MRISIGSDHRGFEVKNQVRQFIEGLGHQVTDEGTTSTESVDYPDYAAAVARQVAEDQVDRGILICSTGTGMSIAANKVSGVRAANCCDEVTAEYSRRHNNANVLCLSADLLSAAVTKRVVELWLKTEFEGGHHTRRIDKIEKLESTDQSSG